MKFIDVILTSIIMLFITLPVSWVVVSWIFQWDIIFSIETNYFIENNVFGRLFCFLAFIIVMNFYSNRQELVKTESGT